MKYLIINTRIYEDGNTYKIGNCSVDEEGNVFVQDEKL